MSYRVYEIDSTMKISNLENSAENSGYLSKFWVEHPQLGKSLIKLEEKTAPAWSEKVSQEIAKSLKLPATNYEFGYLNGWDNYADGTKVMLSPNFKNDDVNYIEGQKLLNSYPKESDLYGIEYKIERVIQTLEISNTQLPPGYEAPPGINNGADLFVGYLLLDSLIANNDRHSANWEIGLDNQGNKFLAPLFDNGASFATTFNELVYGQMSVEKYMNTDLSYFGEFQTETFRQAANLKPEAAAIWLKQLENNINQELIRDIFEQIPQERITPQANIFAQELISYNQQQLLSLEIEQNRRQTLTAIDRSQPLDDALFDLAASAKYLREQINREKSTSQEEKAYQLNSQIKITKELNNIAIVRNNQKILFGENLEVLENNFQETELRILLQDIQQEKQTLREQNRSQEQDRDNGLSL